MRCLIESEKRAKADVSSAQQTGGNDLHSNDGVSRAPCERILGSGSRTIVFLIGYELLFCNP